MNFEAKVDIGGFVIAVQDGQVLVYEPDGNGTSVSIEDGARALDFITKAAKIAAAQEVAGDV